MKSRKLANRLWSIVLSFAMIFSLVFLFPVNYKPNISFVLMDTWENGYDYYDNGTVVEDLGIREYNNYLRTVNTKVEALPEVVIAVIDSGINMQNNIFTGRVRTDLAINLNDNAGNQNNWNIDLSGHGSHVSGIIADNTLPNVKILPIRIFVGDDKNEKVGADLIENAIDYVVAKKRNNVNIVAVNMSLGTSSTTELSVFEYINGLTYYQNYINKLRNVGILPIVAAGNYEVGEPITPSLPAACEGVLAVSSYNYTDKKLAKTSNYGFYVDISAPGDNIKSADKEGNGVRTLSGTSMATPFVSACYASLMSDSTKTTPKNLGISWSDTQKKDPYYYLNPQHKALLLFATDMGEEGNDENFGYGGVCVSGFAVAPSEIVNKADKTPAELVPSGNPKKDSTDENPFLGFENVFWVALGIAVVVIIIYAIKYRVEEKQE